jgi:hypothetical protein
MNKTLLALSLALAATTSSAANFVSVEVDRVKDSVTGAVSQAQFIRAGVDAYGLNFGLQGRAAAFENGGLLSSVETTVGKAVGPVQVYGGVGFDAGRNGAKNASFEYGLVGVQTGMPVGPVYAFGGVKTRLNWQLNAPKQTVVYGEVSYPLTKKVSVGLNVSKSTQTIKETAYGTSLRVSF